MAFQSIKEFNDKKYDKWFVLLNDQDSADVVFLYEKPEDALIATVHYIKSLDYNGYVHCVGSGCPACARGIRPQTKFFIPLYNITAGEVQFWDRSEVFTPQFNKDVFQSYPNPSEFVFRITRHGEYRSRDTRYSIMAVGKNTVASMGQIMERYGLKFPESYGDICKDCTASEMQTILNNQPPQQGGFQKAYGGNSQGGYSYPSYGNQSAGANPLPNYQVTPRAFASPAGPVQSEPLVAPPNDAAVDDTDDLDDDVNF